MKVTEEELEKFYSSEDLIKSAQSKIYIDKKIFNTRVKNISTPKVQFANDQIIKNGTNISNLPFTFSILLISEIKFL